MEINSIGTGRRKLLIIDETSLNFIQYDNSDEVINVFNDLFKDKTVEAIVSSDSHGDDSSLELPFKLPTKKRIFLGDYYPYIPSWFKYREKDKAVQRQIVDYVKDKYMRTDESLAKHLNDESSLFLFGNHDPRIFPVSFELTINGFKFLFQHSLTYHNKAGKPLTMNTAASSHFLDVEEELWKDISGPIMRDIADELKSSYTIEQVEKPLFVLPSIEPEYIDIPIGYDYIIVGHLSSYQWLFDKLLDDSLSSEAKTKISSIQDKLYTIDSSNSSVIDYLNQQVHERKLNHYRTRIAQITSQLPSLKPKLQVQQTSLLDRLKVSLAKEESKYASTSETKPNEDHETSSEK